MATAEVALPGARSPAASSPVPPRVDRTARLRAAWLTPALWAGSAVVLFFSYLAQARTIPTLSDGASQALQGWDMLHGNLLLHGWSLSDVSFYTTELPEYMLVELVRGLNGDVVHVAAALTYTLLVVLVVMLAKGRASGREGLVRVLVAATIMLAPSLGASTRVLMSYPDHTGTQVPLLLIWLVLDRARQRWWVPVAVTVLLASAQVADTLALFEGVLPVVLVCAVRVYRKGGPLAAQWYELALAGGAIASAGAATLALRLIRQAGGFAVRTPGTHLASSGILMKQLGLKLEAVLQLFSADFFGRPITHAIILLVHLVGVLLVARAVTQAVRRFYREDDLMVQVLTAAFVVVLAAYLFGYRLGAWEAVGLLPVGAVLASRLLAGPLIRGGLVRALAAVLACCAIFLVHNVSRPAAANQNQPVASWLEAHHLRYGLASYWEASSVTLETGGDVQVRPVRTAPGALLLTHWESDTSWYNSHLHHASFVIWKGGCGACLSLKTLRRAFGQPEITHRIGPYLVLVWDRNLLAGPVNPGYPVSWHILAAAGHPGLRHSTLRA